MACFITPMIFGILIKLIRRLWTNTERLKLSLLEYMLLGGALLLMIEHVLNGEVVYYPPFFTAMSSPDGTYVLIRELITVGGSMVLAVVMAWLPIVGLSKMLETRFKSLRRIVIYTQVR